MQEKTIPTGFILPETVRIIERNGGIVGQTETILRNIQEERPFLNTGATKVIFNNGEYIFYNENGIHSDAGSAKWRKD